ncbi:MAG: sulfatase-like hydrolase/transferase [Akkermansiaceae bacterium]|jgi:arylsulfatase A-like enzyme|nr:sulfatase-like hydrolase/transferase [Akkermansiaceae bacterium]
MNRHERGWGGMAKPVAWGVLGFLVWQYAAAIFRLMGNRSGGMESKFGELALRDYLGFLIGQNLLVLVAYVIVGVIGWLLLVPYLGLWRHRLKRFWPRMLAGFAGAAVLHGYFMFRLVHDRPYFTGDAAFGNWYYGILEWPPESWQPWVNGFAFDVLPWLVVSGAIVLAWRAGGRRFRGVLIGMLLLGISGFAAQRILEARDDIATVRKPGADAPPNIIIIGSDSLRGDRLGYTGYRPQRSDGPAAEGVSPNIDRWAKDAVKFMNARTPMGSTLESNITTMTSTWPHTHGIRQMFPPREDIEAMEAKTVPLAKVLRQKGYRTAAVGDWCAGFFEVTPLGFEDIRVSSFDSFRIYMSQAVMMAHFVVPLYFDNDLGYRLFPQIRSFAQFVTPEVVTRRVEGMIEEKAAQGGPFFLNVFYSCNHLPFRAAEPYCRMFADPEYRGPNATGVDFDIDGFIGGTDLEDKWNALPEAEVRQIRALYDGCTRQFDTCFGRIIAALEKHGLLENSIVVLSSDHGDDLYEPGVTLGHGLTFEGAGHGFHIPLAMRVPGAVERRIDAQVRTLDIAPTLARLAGAEPDAGWEGQDLSSWIRGEAEPRDLPYFGETQFPFIQFRVPGIERPPLPPMDELTFIDPDYNHQFVMKAEYRPRVLAAKQHCLRTRDWKLVMTPTVEGTRHFQLYHMRSDPDGLKDLAETRPEVLAPLRVAMEKWLDHKEETPVEVIFPEGEPG